MDQRAYTYDPNALLASRFPEEEMWWHSIGPTRKPSPYATATWTYYRKVAEEPRILPAVDDVGLDRLVTQYFVSVEVYDSLASFPGEYNDIIQDPNNNLTTPYELQPASAGTLLGKIDYEILDSQLLITDWSHYNWHDSTPVKKAFEAIIYNVPDCVDSVLVRSEPIALWTSLGFISPSKGSDILIYNEDILKPIPY